MFELRRLFTLGALGALPFGVLEGLWALSDNAFVQPDQYGLVYVAAPVLAWMAIGVLVVFVCHLISCVVRPFVKTALDLSTYAGVVSGIGAIALMGAYVSEIHASLRSVGGAEGVVLVSYLWAVVMGAAALFWVLGRVVVRGYTPKVEVVLERGYLVVLIVAGVSVMPVANFLATDWKFTGGLGGANSVDRQSPTDAPNVLLISVDTLRADYIGAYGGKDVDTPRIDQLAREGVVFEEALSQSPWTLPAIASLMSGLNPRSHGAGRITNRRDPLGRSPLPSGTETLVTALAERGYVSHAIVTNPYLALRYGFGEGFGSFENLSIVSESFLAFENTTLLRLLCWAWPSLVAGDRGADVSARASEWLSRQDGKSAPFFLWLHYIDPHPPFSAPGVARNKTFRSDSLFGSTRPWADDLSLKSPDIARLRSGEIRLTDTDKEQVRALYRAEVRAVDTAIGSVLDALEMYDLADRTMVVLVSDHGEEFWEHGSVEHGHTVYDELLRIPLIIKWPDGRHMGRRVEALVRLVDVFPTVLEMLGTKPAAPVDGESALPLVTGDDQWPRVAVAENMLFSEERTGIRTQHHKYVRWADGREEVYDLRTDPAERLNLVSDGGVVEALRLLYLGITSTRKPPSETDRVAIDEKTNRALRALGYIH